ncbi:MAG: hypothetical protein ABW043_17030 [Devosia sp.]|uniref:hypothetical protein n=1 Tax=Devosia sp. TaxID=1871048 RepID=UPI00339A183F
MTALATIEPPAQIGPSFEAWLEEGRDIAAQRRNLTWAMGDHLATGKRLFPQQWELLLQNVPEDRKELQDAAMVAETFPAALRAPALSFQVHKYLAQLDPEQRLPMLKRAVDERWGKKQASRVLTEHKQETAQFDDDDAEARLATEMFRAWNRAPQEARRYAAPLLQRAIRNGFAAINEDEAWDE